MDPNREPLRKIPVVAVPAVSGDIGSALKARREARGHSLDAVSRQTRIPKKFLEAMEKNQLDEFPALVYLRGFLKSYCEHLELNFEELWALVQPPAQAAASPAEPQPAAAPPRAPAPQTAPEKKGWAPQALLLCAVLALLIFLATRKSAVQEHAAPAAAEAPSALTPLSALSQPTLSIIFRQDAWISLKADGAVVFEGRAPQGARQEWKAKKGFSLRAPQPQNIELVLNSNPYRLPAEPEDGEYKIE